MKHPTHFAADCCHDMTLRGPRGFEERGYDSILCLCMVVVIISHFGVLPWAYLVVVPGSISILHQSSDLLPPPPHQPPSQTLSMSSSATTAVKPAADPTLFYPSPTTSKLSLDGDGEFTDAEDMMMMSPTTQQQQQPVTISIDCASPSAPAHFDLHSVAATTPLTDSVSLKLPTTEAESIVTGNEEEGEPIFIDGDAFVSEEQHHHMHEDPHRRHSQHTSSTTQQQHHSHRRTESGDDYTQYSSVGQNADDEDEYDDEPVLTDEELALGGQQQQQKQQQQQQTAPPAAEVSPEDEDAEVPHHVGLPLPMEHIYVQDPRQPLLLSDFQVLKTLGKKDFSRSVVISSFLPRVQTLD